MRTRSVLLAILFLGPLSLPAAGGSASTPDPAIDHALSQIRPEAIRAHIEFLADDLLEGRAPGTRGYELAARYVASQFEMLGLTGAGDNGTYFQAVPFRTATLQPKESSLTLVRGGQAQLLTYGQDYVMTPDFLRPEVSAQTPLVFAGFGVTAPELHYDDYARVDARGKVIVVLRGAPSTFHPDQRAHYSSRRGKQRNAIAHGAVGMLSLMTPESERRIPWQRVVRRSKMASLRWLDKQGAPSDSWAELRGLALLSRSGAEAVFMGAPTPLEEVFAAAKDGHPPAFDLSVKIRMRTVSQHGQIASANVAAILPGSDPHLRAEYVVYTAHLDHIGVTEPVEGDAINNGAYDNASGVATLLEIARAFTRLRQPPRRSLLFLAVTAEERGLLGSDYFARHPTVPRAGLVANVNLDMFLMLYPVQDIVAFGAEHSTLGAVVQKAAARVGLEVTPDPMPEQSLFIRSDQYSFVRQGVPAVFMMAGFKSADPSLDGAALVEDWLKTRYHSPTDDLSQEMDFASGVKFTQTNFLIGYWVANQMERPIWNHGDFFGERFGRHAAAARPASSTR